MNDELEYVSSFLVYSILYLESTFDWRLKFLSFICLSLLEGEPWYSGKVVAL
jgi:hypothetical protein